MSAVRILGQLAPIMLGMVLGGLFFYTIQTWGLVLEDVVRWLAQAVAVLLVVSVLLWIIYRLLIKKSSVIALHQLSQLRKDLENTPDKISDPKFRAEYIWPLAPTLLRAAISWFGFTNALAIVIAIMANLVLLATLAVQYLSAQRLEAQNLLLGNQNQVLSRQTGLLESQVVAANVEQLLVLDEKIAKVSRDHEELLRIVDVFERVRQLEVEDEILDFNVMVKDASVHPCQSSGNAHDCRNAVVWEITEAYNDHPGGEVAEYPHKWYPAFQVVANYLQERDGLFTEATGDLIQLKRDDQETRDEPAYVRSLVERVGLSCAVEPRAIRDVSVRLSLTRAMESNAGLAFGSEKFQTRWKEWADEFEQVRGNISRGNLNYSSALAELARSLESGTYDRDSYTLGDFTTDLRAHYTILDEKLTMLSDSCNNEVSRLKSVRVQLKIAEEE